VVLWVAGIVVLLPVVIPLLVLVARVLGDPAESLDVLGSGRTLELLVSTLLLTAAVTLSSLVIGTTTAWLTVRTDLRARRTWSVLVSLPLVIPSYVVALVLLSAFGVDGVITRLLSPFGIDRISAVSGSFGAWAALTLATYPFVHLIGSVALRKVDPALEEAARGLGASGWRAFRTVSLPQLRPSLGAAGLLVALYTISDFGAVSLMRFDAFTRVIYAQYQGRTDRTPAAVLAVVLLVVVLVILWAEQRTRGRARYSTPAASRPARQVSLQGPRRVGAVGFLSALVGVALVMPIIVLLLWLGRSLEADRATDVPWQAALGSLWVSLAAAVLAMAAAIPVAVLVVRYRSRASVALDRAVYGVYALPHIAVALAMVFFTVNYLNVAYQSFAILIVTYVALFLPQASGAARGALEQVNPHVEEAARSLGKGPGRTLATVTVPLIRTGLLAGGGLVFLTTMKERPATLLLRPTGFDTLAVEIWSAASEGVFSQAAVPALLLLAVSAVPMYLLVTRIYES
jgi:iron(III) transport system permease protein